MRNEKTEMRHFEKQIVVANAIDASRIVLHASLVSEGDA